MGSRCTGHCCEGFVLPLYEELPQMIKEGRVDVPETEQILGMVVLRRIVQPGQKLNDGREAIEPTPVFGCKNFNAKTRNCGIYETRPAMCRDYPYGKPCEFQTCEWDKGRAGTHPPEPELVPLRRKYVNPKVMPIPLVVDEPQLKPKPARPPLVVSMPTLLSQVGNLNDQRAIPAAKPKVPPVYVNPGTKVGRTTKVR